MTTNPADAWLRRVQALLAKAESTDFPAEAETLLAKAQELMARHAIDEAMLDSAGRHRHDVVTSEVIRMEAPYAGPKASLLCRVAEANGCRAVTRTVGGGPRQCVIVGHRSDLDGVMTLFAALSMHATRAMLQATVPPYDTPRRFRHAFLLGFAARIGERLRAAARAAEADAAADADAAGSGGASVAVVLASRADAVERAFEAEFPHVRFVRSQASSYAGAVSGRTAADAAALGQRAMRATPGLPAG
jgi:hypothetical protein